MSIYSDTEIPTVYYTPENPNDDELVMSIDNTENVVYVSASNNDTIVMLTCALRSDIIIGIAERSIRVDLLPPNNGATTFYVKELEVIGATGHDPTEGLDVRELP